MPKKITNENQLNLILDNLKSAKKQQQLLFSFLELTKYGKKNQIEAISKKDLLNYTNINNAILNELLKKGILQNFKKNISRLTINKEEIIDIKNSEQSTKY